MDQHVKNRAAEYNGIAERIVAHYENNTTDMADGVLNVPLSAYLDPDQWQREIDLIFKKVPLVVALTCEMSNVGDYKALDIAGVPLLVTRGKDGEVRAFMNACRHRGTPVVEDGCGHASRFTCPYHGWTYASDGRLLAVAEKEKFGDVDNATTGLVELPCAERVGFIFAILTPGLPIDLAGWMAGMDKDIAPHGFENWTYLGSRELNGPNWKISYDGYLEGYHFAALHKETILKVTLNNLMDFDAFGPHQRVAYGTTNIEDIYKIPRDEWGQHENVGFTFVRLFFPNISTYLGLGVGQIAQLIPGKTVGENRTILH
ncbi:MAG: aromatic ring-hydroxylating dioxygenase subunit alpha, partial [Proteobacteria bacterium]|nr:aromatic ring-hydroxylating dioxygenase subunit alpha [Pseudomonadota bacterium]